MADFTLVLDKTSTLGLQDQLRQKIVEAIYAGTLRPGRKMPSSRALAMDLGVSRNTVVLAYSDLVAEGHLDARDRSGIFVSHKSVDGSVVGRRLPDARTSRIAERMQDVPTDGGSRCPQNWRQYPYPFWDGRVDASLVPVQEWRKAVRLASCPRDAMQWSDGSGELDDPILLDELCTKVLPERGIGAHPEEVLVLHSVRQALQFLVTLLLRPGSPVWIEEPVDPEVLVALRERGARVECFLPDAMAAPPKGVMVVTSARTGISSGIRTDPAWVEAVSRNDGVVIEVAVPADTLEAGATRPALYASTDSGNVIHVACLSPVAACGVPLAYVVSDASVTARLRELRRISGALPNLPQQRTCAYFLALGYYASSLHRARRALTARKTALRDALNHYLHPDVQIGTVPGVSAYWVGLRDGKEAQALANQASAAGVLIQPARLGEARHAFTMGVTSIPEARIREGVRVLAGLLRASRSGADSGIGERRTLSGGAMRRALAGRTLLYNTVYGEPCTIRVCRSGELIGMAGYANDDPDRGRWWIEGDRWYRQWEHWAYGEVEGYAIAVDGERVFWYDAMGSLVDKAVILRGVRE